MVKDLNTVVVELKVTKQFRSQYELFRDYHNLYNGNLKNLYDAATWLIFFTINPRQTRTITRSSENVTDVYTTRIK